MCLPVRNGVQAPSLHHWLQLVTHNMPFDGADGFDTPQEKLEAEA